jgi:urease accessory protein
MRNSLTLLRGLRFIDSFFPSGGYAFSSGLEAAVQGGTVRNAADLARYVEDVLQGGMSRREAVAVGLAHKAAATGKLETALSADRELDAMKLGRESRLASRQMGRQIIRVAAEQTDGQPLLKKFRAAMVADHTPGHLPVVLGLTLGSCGWTREAAVAAFLYQTAVGFVSAAMKLLPIGQREGQRLLDGWLPMISRLSADAGPETRMNAWAPVQDIYAMRQGRLEHRLFRS